MPDDDKKTATNDNLTVGPPLNNPGSPNASLANDDPKNTNQTSNTSQNTGSAEDELKAVKDVIGDTDKQSKTPEKSSTPPKPVVEETSATFPPVSTESAEAPPPPPFPTEQQSGIPVPPKDEDKEDNLSSNKPEPESPPPPPNSGAGIPPVVTTPKPKRKFGGKKIVATILGLLLLVGGIGAGVILVQNQQDIRNRAGSCTVGYTGTTGECRNGKTCRTYRFSDCTTEVRCDGPSCSGSSPRFSPTSDNGGGGGGGGGGSSGVADGTCLGPGQTCSSGKSYFDTSCSNTETRCGTQNSNPGYTCREDCYNAGGSGAECSSLPSCSYTTNACTAAGGTCITANNCTFNGRTAVNGGSGCGNASQVCCSSSSSTTPVGSTSPTTGYCDRSAPDVAPGPNNKYCTDVEEGYGCVTRSGVSGSCKIIDGSLGANTECKCATGTTTTIASPVSSPTSGGGSSPNPSLAAQCLNVQVYDTNWQQLTGTQLSSLKAGDKIRFVVSGTTNTRGLDKARFTVNGVTRPEVTTSVRPENNPTFKAPSTDTNAVNYYDEYTIPQGVTSFTVQAELHHTTLGWFGK